MPQISWIQAGLGALAAFALSYLIHTVLVNRLEAEQKAALINQVKTDNMACEDEKAVTKEATDALQKNRDDLADRVAKLKLQQRPVCVPVTRPADVHDRQGGPAGQNGISSGWLIDFAADDCSSYWRQLKICDKFLDDERAIKPR